MYQGADITCLSTSHFPIHFTVIRVCVFRSTLQVSCPYMRSWSLKTGSSHPTHFRNSRSAAKRRSICVVLSDTSWTVHHRVRPYSLITIVSLTVEVFGCSMSQLKSPIVIMGLFSCIPHSTISCKFPSILLWHQVACICCRPVTLFVLI